LGGNANQGPTWYRWADRATQCAIERTDRLLYTIDETTSDSLIFKDPGRSYHHTYYVFLEQPAHSPTQLAA
jgi:hypothetical protein